ncbi:MAG TPA: CPBP family intramembrane glutamic endopeptidase [Armatimonadota bacterium]
MSDRRAWVASLAERLPGAEAPAWRENGGLLLGLVLLGLVWHHGQWPGLDPKWREFGWFGINFVLLFLVPALVIKFVWHQRLSDYGVTWGRPAIWGRYVLAFAVVMVPLIVISSRMPAMQMYYPRSPVAREGALGFALAAGGWLVYFFAWEFFFRGFLLNLLLPRFGAIAIVVQTIPFMMMHFTKPEVEVFAAIAAGLALGLMAYRGKSMVGPWLTHWFVAILLDALVVWWPGVR